MKQLLVFLSCLLVAIAVAGCSGDDSTTEGLPASEPDDSQFLKVNIDKLQLDYQQGSRKLQVESNAQWHIKCKHDWLSFSSSSGEADGGVTIVWPANLTYADRSDTITVSTDHRVRSIPVFQQHKADTAHVVSSRAMMGNLLLGQTDTIEVCFDTPVKVSEYVFDDGRIGATQEPTMADDNRVFRLPFNNGRAGMELNCKFTVSSLGDGTVTELDFMIPFYAGRFPIDASGETVRHSVMAEDGKSIWVSIASVVTGRHRVVQVSLPDCSQMQSVEVPFAPGHVCINPYNNQLYVLPANGSVPNAGYSNTFCAIDPQRGAIVKTFTIDPSPTTHPQWPAVYPDELEFTKDGLGILLLTSSGTDEREWRYVDSADDDRITLSGYKWHDYEFEHVYQNFDRTRIYATEYPTSYHHTSFISRQNKVPTTITIHGKFESDKYYAGGNLVDLRMSPFADKAFICTAPGSQCVVSLDPLGYSGVCEVEARRAKCAWDECIGASRDLVYQVCPTPVEYSGLRSLSLMSLFDMTDGHHVFATYHSFQVETYNEPMNCHFLKDTDQLVVVGYLGVYLFDAADMKRRSL